MRAALAEQTWVDYKPASFGSRSFAYALDFTIRWGAIAVLFLVAILIPGFSAFFGQVGEFLEWLEGTLPIGRKLFGQILLAFGAVLVFTVEWGYPIFFELRRDGVTPGKRMMGLRVVNQDGLPITWRASLLRNILTTVDLMPGVGMFALISMLSTKHHQRLGDLIAGTMVIHDDEKVDLNQLDTVSDGEVAILLPLETYTVLGAFLARIPSLTPSYKREAMSKLRTALAPHTTNFPVTDASAGLEVWLRDVYRRAKPIRKKFTEHESDRSIDLKPLREEMVKTKGHFDALVSKRTKPTKASLYEAALGYQRLCQLYAFLATFYPFTAEANLSAGMVRYGRRLIYGRRLERSRSDEREPFLGRVVLGYQAAARHILFASGCAVLSAFLTAALIQLNPELSWYFLAEELAEELRTGHIWTDDIRGMETLASSKIMTNNIAVSFTAFALGIFGGFGAVIIMVFNGAHLGGIFSALTHYGMADRLGAFILAHGFLELSIIGVAGGCGVYIGDGLLNPGLDTRGTALRKRARQIVELLLFSAICLVPCGLVEGHISPAAAIPTPIKAVVGIWIGYLYWSVLVTGKPFGWNPLRSADNLAGRIARFMIRGAGTAP